MDLTARAAHIVGYGDSLRAPVALADRVRVSVRMAVLYLLLGTPGALGAERSFDEASAIGAERA